MKALSRIAAGVAVLLLAAAPAGAQSTSTETRPASTTILGDTGLWFVPLGETVPKGRWAGQAARVNFERTEAFSDISDINGMFAFGATDRLEVFGTLGVRRIDADHRPVQSAGVPMDYLINNQWKQGFGDIWLGAKFNVVSQSRAAGNLPAFAVRAAIKLPTASEDDGLGTGGVDFRVDGIVSSEINQRFDVAANIGIQTRSSPDQFELSSGLKWGFGVGFPSRSSFKFIGEFHGETYFDKT